MGLTGAILGDIIGSRFEFEKEIPDWDKCELFHKDCVFTDDTVQSLAIGLAEISDRVYAKHLHTLCNKYLFVGYGGNFHRWLMDPESAPRDSWGNGSAMRVSAIGETADSLAEAEAKAESSAKCTHDSPEAIRGAKAIAGCVYMAKKGCPKTKILKYAQSLYPQDMFEYYVGRSLSEYRADYKFEVSCDKSVPVAIQCFAESDSFASCMRKVLYMNGDTDTLGAMAGAIAESFYPQLDFAPETVLREFLDMELFDIWKMICNAIQK